METLVAARQDIHQLDVDGRRVLLHIPSTALFELDASCAALLDDALHGAGQLQGDPDYRGACEALRGAGLLQSRSDASAAGAARAPVMPPKSGSLVSLVLNVNTGCNLSCTYCYKEDLAIPARGRKMTEETARKSVDLLFSESGARDRISLVFFGGEPLTNVPVIRAAVAYANEKSRPSGKKVQFSLTTNATLLTEELVDFFAEHNFGISISIDGPKAMHDRHRLTVGGRGTYDLVAKKTRMLMSKLKSVSARVTLTHASHSAIEIFDHLRYEIGFREVGIAPVTAGKVDGFGLNAADRHAFFEQLVELGERYVQEAIEGRNLGFTNIHQSMLDLAQGNRKLVPCGAGVGLLAVDMEGKLNLCHRFTGSDLPTFGDLIDGVDHRRLNGFLAEAQNRDGRGCATCRIRNLCSGGCYHDNYTTTRDPLTPSYQHCDDLRAWMDYCIGAFVRIRARNPSFMSGAAI